MDENDQRAAHGGVLLAALALAMALPEGLRRWPLYWVLPLAVYAAVVLAAPGLGRTFRWLALGRADRRSVLATAAIAVAAAAALVAYEALFHPPLERLLDQLPRGLLGSALFGGAAFVVLNPVLEEVVFRGILLDAIEAQWGWKVAIAASAAAFGAGHAGGYPPGLAGAVLAGGYGIALGVLRRTSRGLAAPIAAHFLADATILGIIELCPCRG